MMFALMSMFLGMLCLVNGEQADYSGHMVLRVIPETQKQVNTLLDLEIEYDVWKSATNIGEPVDIRTSPQQTSTLLTRFLENGINHNIMIEDVGKVINDQKTIRDNRKSSKAVEFDKYNTLAEIQDWIAEMAVTYSDIAELITLDTLSFEGRPITLLKISSGGTKNAMWLDGGIHSREWVSPASMIFFINEFLIGYTNEEPDYVEMLNLFDWYILPVFNVDGYEYTWTNDRMWRKTRSTNEGSACIGTDPNRNWDIEWGTVGVSHNPCTDTYCGSSAFSEIEVATVVNYIETIPDVKGYFAYHSYSQFYMTPVGYTADKTPDWDDHITVCNTANEAIFAVHQTEYECNQLYELVGASSGSSADYMYVEKGIKYSYGVELRDKGEFGFLLPEDQIIPTAEENLAGIKVFARQIAADV